LLIGFLFAFSVPESIAIAASNESATDSLLVVPIEARSLAETNLREMWRALARDSPSILGLPFGVDVANAMLGEPYFLFKLAGGGLEKFMDSTQSDPRSFAAIVHYCFPIELPDRRDAGTLIIARNRNDVGEKFVPSDGEFLFGGFFRPDDATSSMIRMLRAYYRTPCAVEYVDIAEHQFLVTGPKGNLLSGQDRASLKPIDEDARRIRDKIHRFRQLVPESGER